MTGIAIRNSESEVTITLDKRIYNDAQIKGIFNLLDIESFASEVDFNEDILTVGNDIKTEIWEKRKNRIFNSE